MSAVASCRLRSGSSSMTRRRKLSAPPMRRAPFHPCGIGARLLCHYIRMGERRRKAAGEARDPGPAFARFNELKRHGGYVSFSALIAVWPSMAYAKITIRQAQYTGGMLLVRGETARAGQTVTVAGRYKTCTDRNGRFRFRARYLPRDCLLDVRSGPELDLVSIANRKP